MTTARGTATTGRGARGTRAPRRPKAVFYPETDGKPMAETPIHWDDTVFIKQTIASWYRDDPAVLVGANIMLYWVEGDPKQSISPDVFVAKGVERDRRRNVYLVWEEGSAPVVVFEVTSKSTRGRDLGRKREIYAQIGVREYYLYDPLAEWLVPALQGYRLENGQYERMAAAADGSVRSEELGLRLVLEGGRLRLYDAITGALVLSPAQRTAAAEARAATEADARRLEAERAQQAELLAASEAERAQQAELLAASEAERAQQAELLAASEAERARQAELLAGREAEARQAAEARIAELEVLLRAGEPPPT